MAEGVFDFAATMITKMNVTEFDAVMKLLTDNVRFAEGF